MTDSDVDPLKGFSEWRTEYVSDGRTLTGFFVAPDGDGPFPGVVFHHGSNGLMAEAKFGLLELVGMGYAVFAPIRRGHNGNPGPFWEDLVTETGGQLSQARILWQNTVGDIGLWSLNGRTRCHLWAVDKAAGSGSGGPPYGTTALLRF